MTDETIRPADTEDAPAIRDVARESWHAAYDEILGSETVEETVTEWYAIDRLRESIADDDHRVFVAESEGLVGFVHVAPWHEDPSIAELARLYVRPALWGDGIGSALLDRAEESVDGYDALRLEVFAENDVGVGFYESRAFARVEEGYQEFGGDLHAVYVYEKPLE